MNEEQKKRLTEKLLKECRIPCFVNPCRDKKHTDRSFLTWPDLGACMEALVREGKWLNFHCFCRQYWLDKCSAFKLGEVPDTYGEYTSWLFRPVNEAGGAHFCALVAEFLEVKDGM